MEKKLREFVKPKVIISKCIEFESCRYDGLKVSSDAVKGLMSYVEFSPICPEVEVGLGIPRYPVRLALSDGNPRLIQPASDTNVTDKMLGFVNSFLDSADEIEGFILKSRSPSCGIKDVKVYVCTAKGMPARKGKGFFGGAVMEKWGQLAVEDEGHLTNFTIRQHFLTKLFALARFRKL